MADNVDVTPGVGKTVRTDDVGGAQYQIIKKATPLEGQAALGVSVFRDTALSNTDVAVKATAGQVFGYHIYNPNASDVFVHLYNATTANVTVGTTTPRLTLVVPAGGILDAPSIEYPVDFDTAITAAATTTVGGSTAPTTSLLTEILYV